MFKRANVVVLPTKEKASIGGIYKLPKMGLFNSIAANNHNNSNFDMMPQYLYIVSDDTIEEGDWCLNTSKHIIYQKDKTPMDIMWKKIIATTDTSIKIKSEQAGDNTWYNPYPKPSDSFISKYIEEYNKGNIITDVMVEYDTILCGECAVRVKKCECFPKPKINPKDNTITIKKIKDSWNREEVLDLVDKAWVASYNKTVDSINEDKYGWEDKSLTLSQWKKQNL